jgi:hypothetical protein
LNFAPPEWTYEYPICEMVKFSSCITVKLLENIYIANGQQDLNSFSNYRSSRNSLHLLMTFISVPYRPVKWEGTRQTCYMKQGQ